MIQQNDTIHAQEEAGAVPQVQQRQWQPSVRQILSWLPKDATPAQQDSAVQAHLKPADIHWSQRPDTLHLPGQPVGRSIHDVSLPQYYRESYFTGKPCFNPDLYGGRLGVAGDPVPYSIAGDNIITLLLLACFMTAVLAYSRSRSYMARQLKHFFRPQRRGAAADISETGTEMRFQIFLMLQCALLLGLVYFFYVQQQGITTFTVDQYVVIGIFSLTVAGYITVKALAYWAAGWVFFDPQRGRQWLKAWAVIVSVQGTALFPIVMLQAYFGTGVATTLACACAVVGVAKILSFYKTYSIFFSERQAIVQNFLYFCTLEMIPMAALWGILTMTCNYLKVNF